MAGDAEFDVLVLAIGDDPLGTVAVAAAHVREVARLERTTAYPGAPVDVRGVTAVRGLIVPVLDLTPSDTAGRPVVLLTVGDAALALAGSAAVRVTRAVWAEPGVDAPVPLRLWSGRVLPLAGAVRLADAARPEVADGPTLPLLDAAALIHDAVDVPDGES